MDMTWSLIQSDIHRRRGMPAPHLQTENVNVEGNENASGVVVESVPPCPLCLDPMARGAADK
jgi:hypothetical protein